MPTLLLEYHTRRIFTFSLSHVPTLLLEYYTRCIFTCSMSHVPTLLLEYHTSCKAPLIILSHSWFLQIRALTQKYSWVEYHTLRFDYLKKAHMIKLSLQMSHITSLPIQISHVKYVVHQTQAIGLTSPPPQHHHIVQAIPISPSPPSPTSALPCVAFD